MIKLYQYSGKIIKETEAEKETANFWIIRGRREAKTLRDYPDQTWFKSPEEAIRAVIECKANKRDRCLSQAQRYQDDIDEASGYLLGVKARED